MKGTGVSNILIIIFLGQFFVHLHAESQWKNTFDDLQKVYNTRDNRKQSKYALLKDSNEQRHDNETTETNDSDKSQETESSETSEENESNEGKKVSNFLRSNSNSNDKLNSLENIVNNYREIKQILSLKHRRENGRRKDSNSDDNSSYVDSFETSNSDNSSSNSSDESSNSNDKSSPNSSGKVNSKSHRELGENSKRKKRHHLRRHSHKSDDSSSSSDSSDSSESNESSDESRSSEEKSKATNSSIDSPKQIERKRTSRSQKNERDNANLKAFIKQFYENKLLEGRSKIFNAQERLSSRRNALWEQLKSKIEWLNNPQNSSFDIQFLRPKNNSTQETTTSYSINYGNHFSMNGKWNLTKNFLLTKSETADGKFINTTLKIDKIFYNNEKNKPENSTDVATSSLKPEIQTIVETSTLDLQNHVGPTTPDSPPGFHVIPPPGLTNNHNLPNWLSPFVHTISNSEASRSVNRETDDNSGTDDVVNKSEDNAAKQDKVDFRDSIESNIVSKETNEVDIVKDNSIEAAENSNESKQNSAERNFENVNKHSTTIVENRNNSSGTGNEAEEYKSVPKNDEINDLQISNDGKQKSDIKQETASVLPARDSLVEGLRESRLKDVLQDQNLTMDLVNFILSLTKRDGSTSGASPNDNVKIEVNGDR